MTVSLKHSTLTGAAADPDAIIGGPEWDAEHTLTQAGQTLLGREAATTGATGEIGIGTNLVLADGVLRTDGVPSFADLVENYASQYANLQAAIDATFTAGGGTVVVDQSYTLTETLDLTGGATKPLRLTSIGNANGGAGQTIMLRFSGTSPMIDADGAYGVEIDHLYFYPSSTPTTIINGDNSFNLYLHDNVLSPSVSSSSHIGVTLNVAQKPVIRRNTFGMNGGTGVRGVPSGGNFSVNALLAENTFLASTDVCIEGPGQSWRVADNIAQNPGTNFIKKGPAGTCDVLVVECNDIDDVTANKTLVTSNAGCLISRGNRYTGSGTNKGIVQDNSTGTVISHGDRFDGATGIDIGTGNYLDLTVATQTIPPTNVYIGTPANTVVIKTVGGLMNVTGRVTSGVAGSIAGSFRLHNATSGFVELVPGAGALGSASVALPAFNGDTVVVAAGAQSLTNKTLNNSNIYTARDDRFTLQDNSDATKQAVFELSGIATATTRTYTLPDATGTVALTTSTVSNATNVTAANDTSSASDYLTFFTAATGSVSPKTNSLIRVNPAIPSIGIGTGAAPTSSLIDIAGGSATLTGTSQLAMQFQPTFSSACTASGYGVYVAPSSAAASFTMSSMFGVRIANGTKGAGSAITTQYQLFIESPSMGTTGYSIYSVGGRNFLTGGTAHGVDVALNNGELQASGFIKSSGATAGIGYATGAGGTVTQLTSRTTGVTINKACGQITLFAAAGTTTYTTFTVTNSAVAATDNVVVNCSSGTNVYTTHVSAIGAGSFAITFNTTGGTASDSPVFNFSVIKGVSS